MVKFDHSKIRSLCDEVVNKPEKMSELIEEMKNSREMINYLLENELTSDEDIELATDILDAAQLIYNYSGNETGLTDSEYDIIYEKVSMVSDTLGITVPVVSSSDTVHHKYTSLRGTLDKVYALTDDDVLENKSRRSLDDWIKTCENKLKIKTGHDVDLSNEEVYCFPKFDGVSGIFEFDKHGNLLRVLTRGYTETNEAQDITHIFKGWVSGHLKDAPTEYGVKTEIMMTNEDFEDYNRNYKTDYKQSRSIVSSIINSDDADERAKYLKIMPLRVSYLEDDDTSPYGKRESLQELAPGVFNTPYIKCRLCDREQMKAFATSHAVVNGLRCDGMVIYIIDPTVQKLLGRENEKQKFEVAYKFTEEVSYSKIEDIEFSAGLFGRIAPVAIIKPIKMKGNTIERVSLGSMGRMKQLNLAKGDKVKVLYDIIPYIQFDDNDSKCKRSGKDPIPVPWCCPDCGKPLEFSDSGDIMYCVNNKCPCKIKGKILNYFNKMHIDNISYATVDTLYSEGYLENIKDIYKLEKHSKKISKIPGFGARSVAVILNEINSHREVPASQMLGSIGIEGVSTKIFEKVLSYISFDELLELLEDDKIKLISVLEIIPGIKEKTAEKIYNGLKENKKLINFLLDELVIIKEKKNSDIKFTCVFTKVRDPEIEKWVIENGGAVKDSVTKDTTFVVVPAIGVESSKVTKANKYGIPIVTIDEVKTIASQVISGTVEINKF
jgi:DNA ligase (NAD+)